MLRDEVSNLIEAARLWAQQFSDNGSEVRTNPNFWDQDYGCYAQIEIIPPELVFPKLELLIVGDDLGFTLENWGRLRKRLGFVSERSADERVTSYVGAYLEPGSVDASVAIKYLNAVAECGASIEVGVYRDRIVRSSASIPVGNGHLRLRGPATGFDLLRVVGVVRTIVLPVAGLAAEKYEALRLAPAS